MDGTPFSAPALPPAGGVPSALDGAIFRLLVEHGPDAIFPSELENEICAYVSPAVQRLLGRAPADLVGRSLTRLVHPDDIGEVLARSLRRRESRRVRTAVCRMLHADGRWIWVQSTASPTLTCDRPVTEPTT